MMSLGDGVRGSFSAKGKGENLGYFGKEENKKVAEKMKEVFAAWIDNSRNNIAWKEWFETGHEFVVRDKEYLDEGLYDLLNFVLI